MTASIAVIKPLRQVKSYRLNIRTDAVNIPRMDDTLLDRIEERLKALNKTANKASLEAGLGKDAIRNWQRKPETLPSMRSLIPLAEVLEVSAHWLMTGESAPDSDAEKASQIRLDLKKRLPVIGEIRAGAWLEIEDEQEVTEYLPFSDDTEYPNHKQYALRVVGSSMDKIAPHGSYVIVIEWTNDGTRGLQENDLVVVRRERSGTYENTLKRAKLQAGEWQLWPESTDPRYQEPLQLNDGDKEVLVTILGKVIGKYERF